MADTTNTTPKIADVDLETIEANVLGSVTRDFDRARVYIQEHYQQVWANSFKAYNSIRTQRGYAGLADDFIPETFSIVESLKASIAGTKPKFKYLPITEEQEQDTSTLNNLVDFYWSVNNMTEKLLNWVGDMIIYGNGIFMVTWEEGKPLIRHIPLSDFFVDPSAFHMNRPEEPGYPRYAGYRFLTSLQQLKEKKKIDVDTGGLVDYYKNLDEIGLGTSSDETDKDRKEQVIGSTLGKDAITEQVEVIDYYTARRHIMIANRSTVILDEPTPYYKPETTVKVSVELDGETIERDRIVPEIRGFLPFAILRNYVDSNLFFARGDVEVIRLIQEALNDTSSQKRDNIAYVLNNMWQIDPRFKHMMQQVKSAPGAVLPLPKGALSVVEKADMSPAADTEISRLTQAMRTATAADAAVQGVSQRFSRTTATEVAAQLNQASMRFTTKVQNLEDEGFAQLARVLYKMIQIFVDTDVAVRVVGKQGVTWQTYDPNRFTEEYEPRVVLESTADAENTALVQAMQTAAQFSIGNPGVNQNAFLRNMYEALFSKYLTDDQIDEMLAAPQPIMGPDGQAIDPALAQGNAAVLPGAAAMLRGEADPAAGPNGGANTFARRTQTGTQGGGGADSGSNNIRRTRSAQPSSVISASSRPSTR